MSENDDIQQPGEQRDDIESSPDTRRGASLPPPFFHHPAPVKETAPDDHFQSHEELERSELATFAANAGLSTTPIPLRALTPQAPKANPDDPPTRRPPRGPHGGPEPGPYYVGLEGRIAIVQGQVFILAVIVIAQLWLVTDALYELLSGRIASLGYLTLASFLGFAIALIVAFWPRRRVVRP